MKDNNLLLLGGGALVLLYLYKKRQTVPAATTIAPGGQAVQVSPASNTSVSSSLLNTVNNVIKQITAPAQTVQPTPAQVDVSTASVDTPITPITKLPDINISDTSGNDSQYMEFENGDYLQAASLAGYIREEIFG